MWEYTQEPKEPGIALHLPSDIGEKSSLCLMAEPGSLTSFMNKDSAT